MVIIKLFSCDLQIILLFYTKTSNTDPPKPGVGNYEKTSNTDPPKTEGGQL